MSLGSVLIRSCYNLGKLNQIIKITQVSSKNFSVKKGVLFNIDKKKVKYTEKHEWIDLNGNIGTIGITDYAQDKLGEVVYVELPEVGTKFEKSNQFATLESVKAVSECYMPVSGSVIEVNNTLKDQPSNINSKPFGEGWLIKIELSNKSEFEKLMNDTQYNEFLKSEEH